MKGYPDYKESGDSQIGVIPAHWTTAGLKNIFRVVGGSTPQSGEAAYWDGDIVWVTPADLSKLTGRGVLGSQRMITSAGLNACGSSLVPEGSLILSTRAPIGSLAVAEREMCTNQGCKALVPARAVEPTFYYFVLSGSTEALNVRGRGTTFLELSGDALGSFPVPIPPLAEQQAIAAFLDRETAKLDALVEEQRRLIALLKEKRQAVISHAVTKGLDPTAPLKPSGIDWLGDIPAHWEVRRIKDIARMESGHTPDRKRPEYWDGDIQWVSLNDTGYLRDHGYISETKFTITPDGIANSSARLLPARVVVFSRDATIGRCAITTKEMAVSQHFIAWVCGERILPEYLLLNLRAMAQELERLTFGATIKTIGMPDVRRLTVALPEVSVQRHILSDVGRKIEKLDALTAEATRAIALLQERRAALISAAVTGKIDVRDATPEAADCMADA